MFPPKTEAVVEIRPKKTHAVGIYPFFFSEIGYGRIQSLETRQLQS